MRCHARPGFTLAELLVVFVLLGLMVGVATPAFTRGIDAEGPDAPAVVVSLLESARATARDGAANVEVVVDPATARAWVRGARDGEPFDTTLVLKLPEGAALAGHGPRVRFGFRADGAAWGDTLMVRDGRGSARVVLDPLTGAVRRIADEGVAPR